MVSQNNKREVQIEYIRNKLEWHQSTKFALMCLVLAILLTVWLATGTASAPLWIILVILVITFILFDRRFLGLTLETGKGKRREGILPPPLLRPLHLYRRYPQIERYPFWPLIVDIAALFYLVVLTGSYLSIFAPSLMVITSLSGYCLAEPKKPKRYTWLTIPVTALYILTGFFTLYPSWELKFISFGGLLNMSPCSGFDMMMMNQYAVRPLILAIGVSFYILTAWWGSTLLARISLSHAELVERLPNDSTN